MSEILTIVFPAAMRPEGFYPKLDEELKKIGEVYYCTGYWGCTSLESACSPYEAAELLLKKYGDRDKLYTVAASVGALVAADFALMFQGELKSVLCAPAIHKCSVFSYLLLPILNLSQHYPDLALQVIANLLGNKELIKEVQSSVGAPSYLPALKYILESGIAHQKDLPKYLEKHHVVTGREDPFNKVCIGKEELKHALTHTEIVSGHNVLGSLPSGLVTRLLTNQEI